MSEPEKTEKLKKHYVWEDDIGGCREELEGVSPSLIGMYIADEADKVIAEKNRRIEYLEKMAKARGESCKRMAQQLSEKDEEIKDTKNGCNYAIRKFEDKNIRLRKTNAVLQKNLELREDEVAIYSKALGEISRCWDIHYIHHLAEALNNSRDNHAESCKKAEEKE